MKVYIFLLIVTEIFIFLAFCKTIDCERKSPSNYGKYMASIMALSFIAVITNIFVNYTESVKLARIAFAVYFSCAAWISVIMLTFVAIYTENGRLTRKLWYKVAVVLAILDSIWLLFNIKTQLLFDVMKKPMLDGIHYVWAIEVHMHMLFSIVAFYIIATVTLALLLRKIHDVSRIQRAKYRSVFYGYFIVIVMMLVWFSTDVGIDISVLFYAFAIFLIWSSVYVTFPKTMVQVANEYVVQENDHAVLYFDEQGKFVLGNAKAAEYFAFTTDEEKKEVEKYVKGIADNHKEDGRGLFKWEDYFSTQERELYLSYVLRYLVDSKDREIGFFLMMEDRTAEKRREMQDFVASNYDDLTGLLNRNGFFNKCEKEIEVFSDMSMCMIAVNIRDFKVINDLFGWEFGDLVLAELADNIEKLVSSGGMCGRISGDKFAFLCPETASSEKDLQGITGRIQELFSDKEYVMHINFGIYHVEDYTESAQSMYDKANLAVKSASDDYGVSITHYDNELLINLMNDKQTIDDFENGIKNGEFCFYLQPQVNRDGDILGAEALVRWNHGKRGLMMPTAFLPLLENRGIVHILDRYIWEAVAQKLKEWQDSSQNDLYISVNISAKDFFYMDIYKELTTIVEKYCISPSKMKLEITESAVSKDISRYIEITHKLNQYGFIVEIDDFGSAYSSLNVLKDIPAGVLKMDREFLSDTTHKERRKDIVESVIYMGKKLDMEIVAEGVETKAQYEILRDFGVDVFQGYFFYRPIPVEEFEALIGDEMSAQNS